MKTYYIDIARVETLSERLQQQAHLEGEKRGYGDTLAINADTDTPDDDQVSHWFDWSE